MNPGRETRGTTRQTTLRKTKIIATIGPASSSAEQIRGMIASGMDIARLNLSHGTFESHREITREIRAAAEETGREIAILADIPGPKLRIAQTMQPREVVPGESITFSSGPKQSGIPIYPQACIPRVYPGDLVLAGDGTVILRVISPDQGIESEVITGGILKPGMGVVIPGRRPDIPYTGQEFLSNIGFAVTLEPDFIALSFVGTARDIREAKKVLLAEKKGYIPIIAKIESREAVDNLQEIIHEADGIMVARGDLGVELPIEQVPHIQKEIISRCNHQGKPVITATEMLESMKDHGRPTRAEVTDVANAIIDGTDATMLSAETSVGMNPVHAVMTMNRIALETENHLPYLRMLNERSEWHEKNVEGIISYHACFIAEELASPAIIAFTRSGLTAERVSRCRPRAPIFAITPDRSVARRLLLRWGIQPVPAEPVQTADELFSLSTWITTQTKTAVPGDQVVIIAGNFAGKEGRTNMIKVQEIPWDPDPSC